MCSIFPLLPIYILRTLSDTSVSQMGPLVHSGDAYHQLRTAGLNCRDITSHLRDSENYMAFVCGMAPNVGHEINSKYLLQK